LELGNWAPWPCLGLAALGIDLLSSCWLDWYEQMGEKKQWGPHVRICEIAKCLNIPSIYVYNIILHLELFSLVNTCTINH
jgi:hypothetical protein